MAFNINTVLDWIEKAFERRPADSGKPPRLVTDTLQAVVEAKGWQAALQRGSDAIITPGPAVQTVISNTPAGEWWYILAADFRCNEAGNKDLRLDYFCRRTNTATAITTTQTIAQFHFLALPRPVLLMEGDLLAGESQQPVGAGFNFQLRYTYIPLAIGEYLPGAGPYGN